MPRRRLYLIPGRGETLDEGLGRMLATLGYAVYGREIVSEFARLRFAEQLALIRSDLESEFWGSDACLVGRSYGAYLILHTLADMAPFPGRVLLCSPVLGTAIAKNGLASSRPPRAERLLRMVESNGFPAPRHMEIHTGADDDGCDPQLAARFAASAGNIRLYVVPGAGHDLGEEYLLAVVTTLLGSGLPRT